MTYVPDPFPTSNIELPPELVLLQEALAQNAHEVWAQHRMNQGWVYGGTRDDNKKTHPCLVPYHDLPEEEKEYDRSTALETIRMILALGYRISKDNNQISLRGLTQNEKV